MKYALARRAASWHATLIALLVIVPAAAQMAPTTESLAKACASVGNDDTVRPYSPSLRAGTERAFKSLFPDAQAAPDASELAAQANFRCMHGKIFVCFIGANLPCAKIDIARDNRGADAFCKGDPNTDVVPAAATGHDAGYSYRCRNGRAEVLRANWQLDARGFAKKLWVELPGQ